ncbi:hypothetical protein AB0B01_04505 [Streptomyces sp. NPDC044571]|uniref:hypothetical protein n=1 Tax=Streptomyces sp. NPDC044571 TaxID=3155371 RepID=UPI0033E17DEB
MTGAVLRQRAALCLRQAVGLLSLVVLGCAASMAVGAFMFVVPSVFQNGCGTGPRYGNVLLHGSDSAADRCEWERVLTELAPAKDSATHADFRRSVEVREGIARTLHIRLSADVPPGSTLAQRVRRGQAAADVSSFVRVVWGVPALGYTEPTWQLPELTADQLLKRATVTVRGTARVPSGDFVLYSRGPTSLRVTLHNTEFRSVETSWHLAAQDPHTLADTRAGGEMLKAALAPADEAAPRRHLPGDGPMERWLPDAGQYVAQAGRVLAATGRALLAAAGWCALLLAYRNGALESVGQPDRIRRLIRITGAAVTVHVVLSVVPWIDPLLAHADDGLGDDFFASVGLWLGWSAAGYAALPGSLVLVVAGILVVIPRTVRVLLADTAADAASCTTVRKGMAVRWFLLSCLLAAVGAAIMCGLIGLQQVQVSRTDAGSAFGMLLVLSLVLGALSWVCGAVARGTGWRIRLSSLLWASAWVPLITMAAAIHSAGGVLPVALRWAGPLVVGTAAVLATGCAAWWAVGRSRPSRTGVLVLLPVALALAVSWNRDELLSPGWWDLRGLAVQLDGVLGLVLAAAAVRALYDCGRSSVTRPRELRGHRALGMLLMFTLAAGGLSLLGVPSWVTACSAAFMAWFLFPYGQIRRAAAVLRQGPGAHTGAVNRSAQSGAARRALSSLRKAVHEKAADGPRPLQRRLRAVERSSYDERRRDQAGVAVSVRQLAFGAYTGAVPWQRALRAALAGAVIGAPWTVLSLAGAVVAARSESKYPVLDIVATAAPILLVWGGYGLLYGYFFPLLRGETGLAKALWTYGLMLVPAVLQVAVSRDPAHWASWTGTLLYALQAFTFAMTLGLCADGAVLAKNRMRPARLTDIHNLGFIAAWWSSVAIALATGVATVIVAGLQPFLLDILPKAPEAPAVSTAPPEAPDSR